MATSKIYMPPLMSLDLSGCRQLNLTLANSKLKMEFIGRILWRGVHKQQDSWGSRLRGK